MGRTLRLGLVAAMLMAGAVPGVHASPITLINATTQVDVYGGEANNGLVPYGGYIRYTDLATGEETTWNIAPVVVGPGGSTVVLSNGNAGGFGSPQDIGGGVVRSTATIAGVMDIQADTSLVGTTAQTVFTFTPIGSNPVGYQFLYYAENDIFSFSDDTATYTGSIAGGDLTLYQYDSGLGGGAPGGGLTVTLGSGPIADAALTAFGSGIWPAWGTALEAGDLSSLSADGSTFVTGPADLGLALLYSLNFASPASITVNYGTQANPPGVPEPATLSLLGLGLAGLGFSRRKQ